MSRKLNRLYHRHSGTALLFAIGITMLLFIIGFAFVITTQGDRQTITQADNLGTLDTALDAVIEQINSVLVEDMFDEDGNLLAGDGVAVPPEYDPGEYHDYPYHRTLPFPGGTAPFNDVTINPGPDGILGNDDDATDGDPISGNADDPWLASIEPSLVDITFLNSVQPASPSLISSQIGFIHISDVYYDRMDTSSLSYGYQAGYDAQNDLLSDSGIDSDNDRISFRNLRATIIDPDARIDRIGDKADSDGDGVSDSRWVRIPGLTGSRGENLYAAIRIIDNLAMINVNTAYRNPSGLTPAEDWDGSLLSHVQLEGAVRAIPVPDIPAFMHGYRCGLPSTNWGIPAAYASEYHNDVALRVLNPDLTGEWFVRNGSNFTYKLYDLSNELEFRNRFLVNSNVTPITEIVWPNSFRGDGDLTISTTYKNPSQISDWYRKAFFDLSLDLYTRRHICTTYSFDRVIVPKDPDITNWPPVKDGDTMPVTLADDVDDWQGWTNWDDAAMPQYYRPVGINDLSSGDPSPSFSELERLAAAIWLGLPANADLVLIPQFDGSNLNGRGSTRDWMAQQMAVNVVDYGDIDDVSTQLRTGGNEFYGFESEASRLNLGTIGISLKEVATVEERHYAVQIYNHGPVPTELSEWRLESDNVGMFNLPTATMDVGDTVVLIDMDSADGFQLSDFAALPAFALNDPNLTNATSFDIQDGDKLTLLGPLSTLAAIGERPTDSVDIEIDTSVIVTPTRQVIYEERTGLRVPMNRTTATELLALDVEVDIDDSNVTTGIGTLDADYSPAALALEMAAPPIDLETKNARFLTVADVFMVPVIGGFKIGPDYHACSQNWYNILNIATSTDIDRGRLNLAYYDDNLTPTDPSDDSSFSGLMRFLTVLAPFADEIDNDGNGRNDDPANDGIDNDNDGFIDVADPEGNETFANYGEATELAVAGRININTAPWFVIAQLPWMQDPANLIDGVDDNIKLARAIVAYRDKIRIDNIANYAPRFSGEADFDDWRLFVNDPAIGGKGTHLTSQSRKFTMGLRNTVDPGVREDPGFANISEILNVTFNANDTLLEHLGTDYLDAGKTIQYDKWYDIRRFGRDEDTAVPGTPLNNNIVGSGNPGPFYDEDNSANDLMERDVLFHRVSNLATVRSDVFTAYILVRLGEAGPQKRVIAIFDRTNVFTASDKPKLVALHPVPDVN